ncbi:MAG TPA: DUF885 family protein, partial [Caulobacteraceae bacterium]
MNFDLSRRAMLALSGAAVLPFGLGSPAWAQPAASGADGAFQALAARSLSETLRLGPVSATALGEHAFDAELDDLSPAGWQAGLALNRTLLAELEAIPRAQLSRANQIDAALLE